MKKLLGITILLTTILTIYLYKNTKNNMYNILNITKDKEVIINKYYIYGTHLNIEGKLTIENDIDEAYIVLKNNKEEIRYNINYNIIENELSFKTAEYINKGIYLDDIKKGKYIILLKTKKENKENYYTLKNETKYENLEYYTITKNKKNNQININFDNYKNKNYLNIKIKENNNNNYYDIIIDAGHGGIDPGATYNNYNESDITLDYSKTLKKELEKLGLKVKLTRENNDYIETYGSKSRTAIPYETKAKYLLSIHLNSCENIYKGGVEIYAPNKADLKFAKKLADNIKIEAKTEYSINESAKKENGVYIRTFTKEEIKESVIEAKENNHNPYLITTDTNYYFIIRETGGITTNAYVDGRNKNNKKNEYYNSNIGTESYLVELGYINYQKDLNNILNNKKGYINGIVKTIKEELNIN